MSKKKERISQKQRRRARDRLIDNCWRSFAVSTARPPKKAQKAIEVLRHYSQVPSYCSMEQLLSKAAAVARENGFKASFEPKGKGAPAHKSKPKAAKAFYASWEWKQLRYEVLKVHGRRCMCCGWRPGDTGDGYLVVDHIKPRSKFPELQLSFSNMQVLCNDCNMGKSNIYEDDFRDEWDDAERDPLTAQFMGIMQ